MRIFSIYKGLRGYIRLIKYARRQELITEKAKMKANIVKFFEKHRLKAAIDAFHISKSSIYNYRKKLKESNWDVGVLNEGSRAPIHRRKSKVSPKVIEFIKNIRKKRGDIGKKKIKILLDKYCLENKIDSVSESTIGKLIKKNNIYYYKELDSKGRMKRRKRKPKLRKKGYKAVEAGDLIYLDAITILEDNIRRYIITAVDQVTKIAFAYCYKNLSSKSAEDFIKKYEKVCPFKIKKIQTDNGGEFLKYFDKYLSKKDISHFFTYPRHPQQNSYVERFNRTIEEEFIVTFSYDLSDTTLVNYHMIDYLIFYNTERPHQSIGLKTPIQFFINKPSFSNMYVTHS